MDHPPRPQVHTDPHHHPGVHTVLQADLEQTMLEEGEEECLEGDPCLGEESLEGVEEVEEECLESAVDLEVVEGEFLEEISLMLRT